VRKSTCFLTLICTLQLLLVLLGLHAHMSLAATRARIASNRQLVESLKLSDLCLFTEARYTRHPAMADHHAAFQDHPMALDHFPSGSLISPPNFRHEAP
jgi:hypothetical protein